MKLKWKKKLGDEQRALNIWLEKYETIFFFWNDLEKIRFYLLSKRVFILTWKNVGDTNREK